LPHHQPFPAMWCHCSLMPEIAQLLG
jgi:hypothetical protein